MVQRFLDMFGPRQVAVAKCIQELDVQVEKAEEELDAARQMVYQDKEGEQRGTRVTVTVLAETDGKAEIVLNYVVSNASWTPLYDIRASIAKSPDATSQIILHYRALITRTTGENWPEVALTLSMAPPQMGSQVPSLSPWKIGVPAPLPPPPPTSRAPARSRFFRADSSEDSDDSDANIFTA